MCCVRWPDSADSQQVTLWLQERAVSGDVTPSKVHKKDTQKWMAYLEYNTIYFTSYQTV